MVVEVDGLEEDDKKLRKYKPYIELAESIFARPYSLHYWNPHIVHVYHALCEGDSSLPEVAKLSFWINEIDVNYELAYPDSRKMAEEWERRFHQRVRLITHFKKTLSAVSTSFDASFGSRLLNLILRQNDR